MGLLTRTHDGPTDIQNSVFLMLDHRCVFLLPELREVVRQETFDRFRFQMRRSSFVYEGPSALLLAVALHLPLLRLTCPWKLIRRWQ
jgi:hypothetical protein